MKHRFGGQHVFLDVEDIEAGSDFVGVIGYQGGGITQGYIYPVHDGRGYNRLFGDGSVRWTKPGPLTSKTSASAPSPVRQMQYFQELDQLP